MVTNGDKTQCRRGHPYDEPNTYRTPAGYRQCRRCKALRMRQANNPDRVVMENERCARCGAATPARRRFYCGDECQRAAKRDKETVRRLWDLYGLTTADHAALLEYQGGACAMCRNPLTKTAAIDHDHATGITRGVLCYRCNHRVLASASDSIELLRAAVAYLADPPAPRLLGNRVGPKAILRGQRKRRRSTRRVRAAA